MNGIPANRIHHLLKTFWSGPGGWSERQSPDGTMTFNSPSGRTYQTKPGGSLFFPRLATPTGELPPNCSSPADNRKTLKMPTRSRTRAAERASRIAWERGLREAWHLANSPPF